MKVSITAWVLALVASACAHDAPHSGDGADPEQATWDAEDKAALALINAGRGVDDQPRVTPSGSLNAVVEGDARYVIGEDTRRPVADSSVEPYSSTVYLVSHFPKQPSGKFYYCSGTLIASDAVLTAAHCVFKAEFGGRATSVVALPGAYPGKGGTEQFLPTVGTSRFRSIHYPRKFDDTHGYKDALLPYDYAVIRLARPLGLAAGFRPLASSPAPLGQPLQMIAYHHDLCESKDKACGDSLAHRQFTSSDMVRKVHDAAWFEHAADAVEGSSGAGISAGTSADSEIYAINIAQFDAGSRLFNIGLLLTPSILDDIYVWMGGP